jgi:hypothetical protein
MFRNYIKVWLRMVLLFILFRSSLDFKLSSRRKNYLIHVDFPDGHLCSQKSVFESRKYEYTGLRLIVRNLKQKPAKNC